MGCISRHVGMWKSTGWVDRLGYRQVGMWKSIGWDVGKSTSWDVEIERLGCGSRHVEMQKSTGWDVEADMLGCGSRQVGMWKSRGWDVEVDRLGCGSRHGCENRQEEVDMLGGSWLG